MVLGVDWMRKHGPILLDFDKFTLSCNMEGKQIELQAITEEGILKLIIAKKLQLMHRKENLCFIAQCFAAAMTQWLIH